MNTINFPDKFHAGDSVFAEDTFEDFLPSDGWVANYYLSNGSGKIELTNTIHINANSINNKYEVTITSSDSSLFLPGFYSLNVVFNNDSLSKRTTKTIKTIELMVDIASIANFDSRNWAEIALENVTAYMQNKASVQQKSYEIQGRKLEQHTPREIRELYQFLQSEVNKIARKQGKKGGSKIYVQFTNK